MEDVKESKVDPELTQMACITIKTVLQPWKLDYGEFESLASMARCSRIIGIGEGSHFVSEFSLVRASMVRYFVEKHGFNALGLECGAIQASRLSKWLNSSDGTDELERVADPLTLAVYGSVLIWLKSYIQKTGGKLDVIGIDLPNTLNPRDDLGQLSEAIQMLDPLMTPQVDALLQSLASITGQSAVVSSAQWGELDHGSRDTALSGIMRLRLRLMALAPVLTKRGGHALFQRACYCVSSIEHTLETLRIMKTFFDGTSLEGDTSVRESFMARAVEKRLGADSDLKMLLLAHNNHIQKTTLSFSGELTAAPMGQHLAHREDYRAIGVTHLGPTVPEMQYPSPESLLGFSVVSVPADEIRKDSVEQRIINNGGMQAPCVILADNMKGARLMRSQSVSIETNVNEAFDAILCTPSANKDSLATL
jgi:erythromycin esterase